MSGQNAEQRQERRWTVAIRRRGDLTFEIRHDVTLADLATIDASGVACIVVTVPEPELEDRIPF